LGLAKGIKTFNLKIPPPKKGIVKGIKTANQKIPPRKILLE